MHIHKALATASTLLLGLHMAGNAFAGDRLPAWYDQPPYAGTAKGFYYSVHPSHVPGYPQSPLQGYPAPIYKGEMPRIAASVDIPASDHVAWCDDRYASYRADDNSFQPWHGPRRQCRSPYR